MTIKKGGGETKDSAPTENGFIVYPKIHRLGKEENEGILTGLCYIQEKIDGANTSIWLQAGIICCGSRNQEITGGFNGFCDYAIKHEGINNLFFDHPRYHLFGEWLVRHSIVYKETSYKKFYLFDIMEDGVMMPSWRAIELAKEYGIEHPEIFEVLENPTEEQLKTYIGKTTLGEHGEGIVIKNPEYLNKFGNQCYAKLVSQEFMEENALVFGGNNKHADNYWEQYVVNKYCTLERVQKIMHKIQPTLNESLAMQHIPRISSTVFHDILTEEVWEISKKVPVLRFKILQGLIAKKAKQIYVDILTNNLSVADYDTQRQGNNL